MFLGRVIFVIVTMMLRCKMAQNVLTADLEELGAICFPRNSCTVEGNRTVISSSCECDEECSKYDDCCVDANVASSVEIPISYKCVEDGGTPYQGAYAINRCQASWIGPSQIRRRCENVNDMSDPILSTPVTLLEERITYRNRYCAECNNADPENLQSWRSSLVCDSLALVNDSGNITGEFVRKNLFYKTKYPYRNKWGIYYWSEDLERDTFYPCEMIFSMTDSVKAAVRFCRPNVISTCLPNWRQRTVRDNCEAYMAVVYVGSTAYRNVHCALCNNVVLNNMTCTSGVLSRRRPGMAINVIMDFMLTDGDNVGEENPCSKSEIFDRGRNRCRKLSCVLPGYKREGTRCVPE